MAREKKSMIGFDPLAWLDNDKPESADGDVEESEVSPKKAQKKIQKKTIDKKTIDKKSVDKKEKYIISLLGINIDETALIKGYELLEKTDFKVIDDSITEVFSKCADINDVFENRDIELLSNDINHAIKSIIESRQDEEFLKNKLQKIANSCQLQGVLPQYISIATESFLIQSKKSIGRTWTKSVSAAWNELLAGVEKTICAAYKDEDRIIEVENIEMETAVMSDDVEPDDVEPDKNNHAENTVGDEHPMLQLNCVQDISKSQALKNDMLKLINDNDEIDINASEVERIDGSALQLLCALFNYADQNNLVINWVKPTDALKEAVNTLGMQNILELT